MIALLVIPRKMKQWQKPSNGRPLVCCSTALKPSISCHDLSKIWNTSIRSTDFATKMLHPLYNLSCFLRFMYSWGRMFNCYDHTNKFHLCEYKNMTGKDIMQSRQKENGKTIVFPLWHKILIIIHLL